MGALNEYTILPGGNVAYNDRLYLSDESKADGSKDANVTRSSLSLAVPKYELEEASHGLSVGDLARRASGSWVQATADTLANSFAVGMVAEVIDTDTFVLQQVGFVSGLSGLTDGSTYYLQDDGSLDTTPGTTWRPVLIATGTTTGLLSPSSPAPELGQAVDFDPTGVATSSVIVRNASGGWQILKNNIGTVAPTVNDDSGDGYDYGSSWIDAVAGDEYVCLNPAAGAAVWKKRTP